MLINEAAKQTALTKKAIEYYIEQDLLRPEVLENGYRDFGEEHIEILKKISVFRKLDLSIEEIRSILEDPSGSILKEMPLRKELQMQREEKKKELLEQLCNKGNYAEINLQLDALAQTSTITELLLNAFPGFYGKYICLHFASFLNFPISSKEQQEAYTTILDFLDNMPVMHFSAELQAYVDETLGDVTLEQIKEMQQNVLQSIASPERFLSENKDTLDYFYHYMQSQEYKNSPAYRLKVTMRDFFHSTGYYDTFIPAMKRLSPAYAQYCMQSEAASQMLTAQYPDQPDL